MSLLQRAHKYFSHAGIGDIQDINYLKGELSIEYAKTADESIQREHNYNHTRASKYKEYVLKWFPATKCSDLSKAEAEIQYWDYIVYKQQAKSIQNTIDQLRDIVIGLQYTDKHLSDIK